MMEIKLEYFLHDLLWLIKEDYNESLLGVAAAETEAGNSFAEGESFAYHRVLNLVAQQLVAFGVDTEPFGEIVPPVGKRATFKKADF